MSKKFEPTVQSDNPNYNSNLMRALSWYHSEVDRKEARGFLRNYLIQQHGRNILKHYDSLPEKEIKPTYGWLARIITNGNTLSESHISRLRQYVDHLLSFKVVIVSDQPVVEKKPTVRDNMIEKVRSFLGELEGMLDNDSQPVDLYKEMQSKNIPAPYVPYILEFVNRKLGEFIHVYETTDPFVKEAYSNFGKRRLTNVIKQLSHWREELENYGKFKKANRKPRAKKTKSPIEQVSKLKYCKEFPELSLKSVTPTEIVGASQVWVYNTKYRRLAVYRTDSSIGLQIKGSSLTNYDPEQCEHKAIRKPKEFLKEVTTLGKVALRKLMSSQTTKELPVNGRINEDIIILRAIK